MADRTLPPRFMPAFGMISLVLGHIALAMFFMPVLGLPLAFCGLMSGLLGVFVAATWRGVNWRWSAAGVAVCTLALGVCAAQNWAPQW
jgi:hypothetical protein